MAYDIAEFFKIFHDKYGYGPADQGQAVSPETIARFRGRLPDRLLEYWAAYGWAGYGRGLYWLVDPDSWQPAVDAWLAGTPYAGDSYAAIGRTAFGELFLWNDRFGTSVNIAPFMGWLMAGEVRAGTPANWIDSFMIGREQRLIDFTDEHGEPLFGHAMTQLGPLLPDEIYAFEPALVLGGRAELANIRKVKAVAHLIMLAGFTEKRFMRAEPGRGLIEVDPAGSVGSDAASSRLAQAEALWAQALAGDRARDSTGELAAYDALLERFGEASEPPIRDLVVKALYNKGVCLGQLSAHQEAIAVYEQVLARFAEATGPVPREYVLKALLNKGVRLDALGRPEAAIETYDAVIAQSGVALIPPAPGRSWGDRLGSLFGKTRGTAPAALRLTMEQIEPRHHETVARALLNKAIAFESLGRLIEGIASRDLLLASCGTSSDGCIRELLAKALAGKALDLGKLGRDAEEILVYDELVDRFASAIEPALREASARALYSKGLTLGTMRRARKAVEAYGALAARFGDATELGIREYVAKALMMQGTTLRALGDASADAAFQAVVTRCGGASEPALQEQVAKARKALDERR